MKKFLKIKLLYFITVLLIIIFKFSALHAEVPDPVFKQKAASPTHTDISGIEFNNDGTKVFYTGFQTSTKVLGYSLSTAWDISTINSSSEEELDLDAGSDDVGNNIEGIEFNADGTKIFATDYLGKMNAHTLSTPFDLTTATQVADDGVSDWRTYLHGLGRSVRSHDITFNSDGTKMFLVDVVRTQVTVVEYNLSTAYDTSTATHNQNTDLTSLTSFLLVQQAMKFDDDGTRMYIINAGTSANANVKMYVFKLSTAYDTSTASHAGNWDISFDGATGAPLDFAFGDSGMKLYLTSYKATSDGDDDYTYEYDLSCAYGVVVCEIDTSSNIGAQVDFAKKVIQHNTSTVFKRFEWLRRNKEKSNLNSNNIKLNIYNPVLASLSNQLLASLDNNKLPKTKSNKWSYWSHGDITFGRAGDTINSKPKEVRTSGLMFGADRKIGDSKFIGAAIRMGKDDVDIISSGGTKLDMEALTLNFYGTNGTNLNALIGLSILRIDQLLSETITGERNGKQVFTAVEFKTKNSYGNLNITPSGKVDFGVTQFSDYTDFGTSTTNNIDTYESHTFKTGGIATGFTFDSLIVVEEGAVKPNGSFEYIVDFTPTTTYQYKNHTTNTTVSNDVEKHSLHNLKGNIGFETVFNTGTTFSINYERLQSLNESSHYDNIFFKLGHISEDDSELAFNFNPLQNYQTNINYKRNIYDFDMTFGSNYNMMSAMPDYGAYLEISNKF